MSEKQVEVTKHEEEESFDLFAKTLKKILETPADERGPAAKAIMSSFQVYYDMIGGAAARTSKSTR